MVERKGLTEREARAAMQRLQERLGTKDTASTFRAVLKEAKAAAAAGRAALSERGGR